MWRKWSRRWRRRKRDKMQMSINIKPLLPDVSLPGANPASSQRMYFKLLSRANGKISILNINYVCVGFYLFRNGAKLVLAALQISKTKTSQLSSNRDKHQVHLV